MQPRGIRESPVSPVSALSAFFSLQDHVQIRSKPQCHSHSFVWEICGNSIRSSWLFNHGILVVNFFNEINIHITRLCNIPPKKPSPGGPFFWLNCQEAIPKEGHDLCAKCDHPIGQLMLLLCHKGEKKNSAGDGASFDSRHQTSSNTVYQY